MEVRNLGYDPNWPLGKRREGATALSQPGPQRRLRRLPAERRFIVGQCAGYASKIPAEPRTRSYVGFAMEYVAATTIALRDAFLATRSSRRLPRVPSFFVGNLGVI